MSRVLVTGSAGRLGRRLVADALRRGHQVRGLGRDEPDPVDITDREAVRRAVDGWSPDLVVHAAAWTDVDACEGDPARAHEVNAIATGHVAEAARAVGAHLVYVSTDFVFDGERDRAYVETDTPAPGTAYGRSKRAGEDQLAGDPGATIARTSWLFGEHGPSLVRTVLDAARAGRPVRGAVDVVRNPTFTTDLAPALLDLGFRRAAGTFHVTNQGPVSGHELAREVLAAAGLDPDRVVAVTAAELGAGAAPRPRRTVLADTARPRLGLLPLRHHREPLAELVTTLLAGPTVP